MLSSWTEIDRLFNNPALVTRRPTVVRADPAPAPAWPTIDVYEEEDARVFLADLPGLSKEHLSVTIEDRILTLSGERRFEDAEGRIWHRRERQALRFSRRFRLAANLDESAAEATFRDGVLTLRVPKTPQAKPLQIEVK